MYDQGGAQLDLTWLEKLPTPDYIGEFENKLINDTRYPSPGLIVPLICDPRSYLTCEHSLRLSMDASPSTLEPTPTGSCQCHPLYSVEAEPKDRALPKGLQTIRGTSECHGRAMVPCEFGRWVWRAGQQTLNKTESINEDLNYWGEVWTHPPSGDREANFLNPEDLHDYTWDTINSTEKFIFTAKSSPCIANAKCELFYDFNERDSFRRGEIWQGFGIHPIIREMMLMSATKLCKCKFQEGFFHNSMHDCIKQEQ
ncbi:uncharacterized protein LOC118438478 [Folsomia candida]|nr:uncharacterized protein LOC118438478 [Folsomia candida]